MEKWRRLIIFIPKLEPPIIRSAVTGDKAAKRPRTDQLGSGSGQNTRIENRAGRAVYRIDDYSISRLRAAAAQPLESRTLRSLIASVIKAPIGSGHFFELQFPKIYLMIKSAAAAVIGAIEHDRAERAGSIAGEYARLGRQIIGNGGFGTNGAVQFYPGTVADYVSPAENASVLVVIASRTAIAGIAGILAIDIEVIIGRRLSRREIDKAEHRIPSQAGKFIFHVKIDSC